MIMRVLVPVLVAALWCAGSAAPAGAQTTAAEKTAIIRQLAPTRADPAPEASPPARAAREVPRHVVERRETVVIDRRTVVVFPERSVDFSVEFAFDSAELLPGARATLLALGEALASPELLPFDFLVAGHTDASGSAAYNQGLSERRAASVRRFLVREFGIAPSRLLAVGFGETRLLVPTHPRSPRNRRVQIVLMEG